MKPGKARKQLEVQQQSKGSSIKELACLVGDQWVRPEGPRMEVKNPATNGDVIAAVPDLSEIDTAQAVDVATDAFRGWAACPPAARAEILRLAADGLEKRAGEMVSDLIAENGKPVREARAEVAKAVATFRYYSGLVGALDGRIFAGARARIRHETRHQALGPVVAITPWNVPMAGPARKLAPALLAGNSVVLKPAEATPLSAIHLIECLVQAGVVAGTVQVLCGRGNVVGERLATDPRVAAVSFTGSTKVGLHLKKALSGSRTRLQLELGGKNAAVIFRDADVATTVDHIIEGGFTMAGQQCTGTSRVLAHREIYEEVVAQLIERVEKIRVGSPEDEATEMGPLISEAQLERVQGFVDRAVKEGASVATGGGRIARPGHFYAPTVLDSVTPAMEIASEEVFGPVVIAIRFDSFEEALSLLNGTNYGLSCAVHTSHLGVAQRIAEGADCGVVVVNGPTAGIELSAPFGGFKMSGNDWKEQGPESLQFYTRTKLVTWRWA